MKYKMWCRYVRYCIKSSHSCTGDQKHIADLKNSLETAESKLHFIMIFMYFEFRMHWPQISGCTWKWNLWKGVTCHLAWDICSS